MAVLHIAMKYPVQPGRTNPHTSLVTFELTPGGEQHEAHTQATLDVLGTMIPLASVLADPESAATFGELAQKAFAEVEFRGNGPKQVLEALRDCQPAHVAEVIAGLAQPLAKILKAMEAEGQTQGAQGNNEGGKSK